MDFKEVVLKNSQNQPHYAIYKVDADGATAKVIPEDKYGAFRVEGLKNYHIVKLDKPIKSNGMIWDFLYWKVEDSTVLGKKIFKIV